MQTHSVSQKRSDSKSRSADNRIAGSADSANRRKALNGHPAIRPLVWTRPNPHTPKVPEKGVSVSVAIVARLSPGKSEKTASHRSVPKNRRKTDPDTSASRFNRQPERLEFLIARHSSAASKSTPRRRSRQTSGKPFETRIMANPATVAGR